MVIWLISSCVSLIACCSINLSHSYRWYLTHFIHGFFEKVLLSCSNWYFQILFFEPLEVSFVVSFCLSLVYTYGLKRWAKLALWHRIFFSARDWREVYSDTSRRSRALKKIRCHRASLAHRLRPWLLVNTRLKQKLTTKETSKYLQYLHSVSVQQRTDQHHNCQLQIYTEGFRS